MILRQGSGFSAEGEHCPPPTWFHLRDRKYGYDVSVPLRAAGYMSMLGFSKTARHVMERLKEIGRQSSVGKYVPDGPGGHGGFQSSLPPVRPHWKGCAPNVGATPGVCWKRFQ